MRAGLLNRRIQLCRREERLDTDPDGRGSGQDLGEWVPYAHVWAQVVYVAGGERQVAQQQVETVDQIFRIRWRSDVRTEDRVVYEGRAYEIVGMPQQLGNREGLELRCFARAEG